MHQVATIAAGQLGRRQPGLVLIEELFTGDGYQPGEQSVRCIFAVLWPQANEASERLATA